MCGIAGIICLDKTRSIDENLMVSMSNSIKHRGPDDTGVWVHPEIANPEFKDDKAVYNVCKDGCTGVGFELWQVQAGTIFDDIFVGDSLKEAEDFAAATFGKKKDGEKALYDEMCVPHFARAAPPQQRV